MRFLTQRRAQEVQILPLRTSSDASTDARTDCSDASTDCSDACSNVEVPAVKSAGVCQLF